MFTHKTRKFIRFEVNILRKRNDLKTESEVNFFLTFSISKENQQESINETKLYLQTYYILLRTMCTLYK